MNPTDTATPLGRWCARVARYLTRMPKLVVIVWLAVAAITNVAWPQLGSVIERQAPPSLPHDAHSVQLFDTMARDFNEEGAQNSAVIVISGPNANSVERGQLHSVLALKLAAAKPDVLSVTDPLADERTRDGAIGKDGRVSLLTVRLRGDPGSPATAESVATVRAITKQTLAGSGLEGYVSGPPGSVADTFVAITSALAKITAATGVLIGVILLVVYRSLVTALVPLVSLGLGIGSARGIVAGLGILGMPVSANAEALMTVVVIAVGIDYSIFLISRFHEGVREGSSPEDGIVSAAASIGPVILASAATVIAASVAIAFAKLRPLASMGPMLAIGVATGCACALTLTPAVLTIAARKGYALPKPERAQAYWERVGRAVVRTHVLVGLNQQELRIQHVRREVVRDQSEAAIDPDVKTAAKMFVSPDGKTVRYLVESTENPYGAEARALVGRIDDTAAAALPNTSLQGATVGLAGFPSVVTDLQHYFDRDLRTVVIATLIVVFLILALLLRAVVAPIYLLITVGLTYLSALGAGVLLFQVILGDQVFWWVPMITFILLVAVGADYNLLLMARLREETGESHKEGVVRTVTSTGSVITSAGMIFAASMFGLIAGGLGFMTQMGFVIGFGILLDTFLVRTVVVPAIAMVLGRYSWWPSSVHRPVQRHEAH